MGVPDANAPNKNASPAKRKVIDAKQTTGIKDFFRVVPAVKEEQKG
jgi:hypothetical protein